jgi:exodeoxyribonuclease V alpha subunit
MTAAALLATLQSWRGRGGLRPLDLAFASFVHELDADAPASLLLAAALLAHLEGQGHSCLALQALLSDPLAVLPWPPELAAACVAALPLLPADAAAARAAWAGRAVVQIEPEDEQGSSPLVLCADRLYLRRHWRHETRVARQVQSRTRAGGAAPAQPLPPPLDPARVRRLMDRLFAPAAAARGTPAGPGALPDSPADTDWQQVACALALRGRLTLITGGPGTGKTTTAARLLVLLQALHAGPQPLRVALAAPTGKAAARLRQAIGLALEGLAGRVGLEPALGVDLSPSDGPAALGPAQTLHALLGTRPGSRRFLHDADRPLDLDVLFVDEASMVHLEMMAALLDAVPATARLVLLGDRDQLASVEAGAVLGDLCPAASGQPAGQGPDRADDPAHDPADHSAHDTAYDPATVDWVRHLTGQELPATVAAGGDSLAQQTVVLRHSHRFSGPIGELARAVNRGDGAAALATLQGASQTELSCIETRDPAAVARLAVAGRAGAPGGYGAYLDALGGRPADAADFEPWARDVLGCFDAFRVLTAVREGPWGAAGLNAAIEAALADAGLLQRRGEWYQGRPVMVTRNAPDLGVFNGDIGLVLQPPGPGPGPLRAYFLDGAGLRSVSVGRLADVETAFAMTVHKSQGSEFGHVVLVLPPEDSPGQTRELVYTGITRARAAFTLVAADARRLATASARLTRRFSGLRALLAGRAAP